MAALAAGPLPAALAQERPGQMVVTARAEVKAEPDMAKFSISVETRAETVEAAREENAETMERLRSALTAAGATPRDLQTKGFSVSPEWQYNPKDGSRQFLGYRVSHTLEVTVNDLSKLGLWLDAAMGAGATQVSGPTFGIRDQDALEARALSEAARRARAKADVLAQATGVFLKRVVSISEQVSNPPGRTLTVAYAALDAAERSAATEISPGEISVTATVTITYEI